MPTSSYPHTSHPVTIDSDEGQILTAVHNGVHYFGGVDGQSYAITIANQTARRVEAVVTVDGLSVIDGEPGAFASRGMVIASYGRAVLEGWRRTLESVRTFRICNNERNSYAAKAGNPVPNTGIVGVAIFEEETRVLMRKSPQPVMRGVTRGAGTSMGEERHSPVSLTDFQRASTKPVSVTTFRYDTIVALIEAGILPAHSPNAFPGNTSTGSFCKPA